MTCCGKVPLRIKLYPIHSKWAAAPPVMLTEVYIEAMLVDENLADLVWEAWDGGVISDDLAATAWLVIAVWRSTRLCCKDDALHNRPT